MAQKFSPKHRILRKGKRVVSWILLDKFREGVAGISKVGDQLKTFLFLIFIYAFDTNLINPTARLGMNLKILEVIYIL